LVVRVETVLLEALGANRGPCQRRIHLIPRPINRNTLHALAKVHVRRVSVGHEAPDHIRMDLVEEQLGMFQCIIQSEGNGAENESEISEI